MATWSVLTTIVSGVLNVAQWVQQDRSVHRVGARKQHLEGIKASLVQFNAMCNDVISKDDTQKPDAMARFVADAAHMAKGIEHQVDIMLGNLRLATANSQPLFRRIVGYLFPATRI